MAVSFINKKRVQRKGTCSLCTPDQSLKMDNTLSGLFKNLFNVFGHMPFLNIIGDGKLLNQ